MASTFLVQNQGSKSTFFATSKFLLVDKISTSKNSCSLANFTKFLTFIKMNVKKIERFVGALWDDDVFNIM